MPYRPYPNADRALHQLGRHHLPQLAPSHVNDSMAAALEGFAVLAKAIKASAWRPEAVYGPAKDRFERRPVA